MRTSIGFLKPVCGIALCGILFGGIAKVQGRHALQGHGDPVLAASRQPSTPTQAAISAAPNTCNMSADEDRAWCEFRALTTATQEWPALPLPSNQAIPYDSRPLWRDWTDKCGVGIDSGTCAPPLVNKQNHPELGNEIVHITRPVQRNSMPVQQTGHRVLNFSSVLFSPDLGAVIKGLARPATSTKPSALDEALSGSANQLGPVHVISPGNTDLKPYATAVKLIWEIVAPNNGVTDPAYVYVPASSPHTGPNSIAPKLDSPIHWSSKYSINPDESLACDPSGAGLPTPTEAAPLINVNCFYHYIIDTTKAEIRTQITNNCGTVLPCTNFPYTQQASLILVGMHVMVFTPERPNWQWMTYYWSPELNGQQGWRDPWRHYKMMTTSSLSVDNDPRHDTLRNSAPAANPYLEGHIDSLNTNCVSCHSMAVYSALPVRRATAVGIVDTQAISPGPGYPATEITAINEHYFDNAVLTHFIWSLADFHPNKSPAAQKPAAGSH